MRGQAGDHLRTPTDLLGIAAPGGREGPGTGGGGYVAPLGGGGGGVAEEGAEGRRGAGGDAQELRPLVPGGRPHWKGLGVMGEYEPGGMHLR